MQLILIGWAKKAVFEVQEYVKMCTALGRAATSRPFYYRDAIEQLDAIGVGSLTVVLLTGGFTGAVLALQSGMTLDQFGARSVVGRLISASMIKELGPVLTALMVTGRVGSGIAAELGSMAVTDQLNALRALGTDPVRKLALPRVIAGVVMVPILTVISDFVGIVGAWVTTVTQLRVASSVYWNSVVMGLWIQDIWMGLIKPVFLGFALVSIACFVGMRTTGHAGGGPQHHTGGRRRLGRRARARLHHHQAADQLALLNMGTPTPLETRLSRVKTPGEPVIVFERVFLAFGDNVILKDISFELRAGYSKIFLGASGAGKSTILKLILGLLKPQAGKIWVNGVRVDTLGESDMMKVRDDVGMVFQEGALFDSLSVRENVGYKLYEESDTPLEDVHRRVEEVLGWVELEEHIDKMPSELSGGQRRRVAIARAMTFQPRILLYDEPTTGLDPITSITIDDEIVKLRDIEGVSSLVVTHQLRDAFYVAERMAFRGNDGRIQFVPATPEKLAQTEFVMLRDGLIHFEGTAKELRATNDPYLALFLS